MDTKNENLLVKLVKRSVGLPTGKSGCCGPVVPAAQDSPGDEAAQSASKDCDCATPSAQDQQPPAQA